MSKLKQTNELKRGRGRPRAFDRPTAVQQAMKLFWDRGYEGTTFDDLIGAMNISPSSFYHEFGNKEQLYREAIDYYMKSHLGFFPRILSTPQDLRASLKAVFEEAAEFLASDATPAGCMISLAGTHTRNGSFGNITTRVDHFQFWVFPGNILISPHVLVLILP